ncbi:hypothetical protein PL8927_380070 [Planktothrix serta PCC 8927]|uniref:NYN domain-containing protein n=1 Tax=Planktothrix serta PCC 8927 TaxID=671068 RepID=A0A7Z9BLJ0_9CYAN|nr:NYN domain-containing protein [Planktothrix serta]VXD15147.1 hypothetical protein PL8927_380070 [Planktothrix serta PCC 8927]
MKPCLESRVAIYGDFQNVRTYAEKFKQFIQGLIKLLDQLFNQKGYKFIIKVYSNWRNENDRFAQALDQEEDVTIIHVPSREKNAVDKKIFRDGRNDTTPDSSIEIVILITGDKDFLPLVKELQQSGKKVILIHGCNVSKTLKKAVDKAYHINEVIAFGNLNQGTPEKLDYPAIISYEEAKKCLIDLIKTVQAKGKKATLALMGSLIKKHPRLSGDKKVLSIGKPDGKIFSKFGKFVEAVIQEGIIQKNCNGELILV